MLIKVLYTLAAGLLFNVFCSAQSIDFEWKSDLYGKPGFLGQGENIVKAQIKAGSGVTALVKDNKPVATIIIADNPTKSAQIAVKELNAYLKKITGVELPVKTDSVTPFTGAKVLIGESRLSRALGIDSKNLADQEYIIRSYDDMLVLIGRDEQEFGQIDYENNGLWPGFNMVYDFQRQPHVAKKIGTIYAVDEFLQRSCDVRWFMPTEFGEYCPHKIDVIAENLNWQLKPWSAYRAVYPFLINDYFSFYGSGKPFKTIHMVQGNTRDLYLWYMRMKLVGVEAHSTNHSLWGSVWKQRLGSNKELWSKIMAKGYGDNPQQLCFTSPQLIELLAQDAEDYANGKSNWERGMGKYFPVMAHDFANWCQCKNCTALKRDNNGTFNGYWGGQASDVKWNLINSVAKAIQKRNLDITVTNCAYAEYTLPPTFELEKNVSVMFCRVLVDEFREKGYKQFVRNTLRDWRKKTDNIYIWEYFDHLQNNGIDTNVPGIFLNAIAEDVDYLRKNKVRGVFNELNCGDEGTVPNYAQDHLNVYAWMKFMSADQADLLDSNALLIDYCEKFYGKASKPMFNFFQTLEKAYTNPENWVLNKANTSADWEKVVTSELLEQLGACLDQAEKLADSPINARRVELIQKAVFNRMKASSDAHQGYLKNRRSSVAKIQNDKVDWSKIPASLPFLSVKGEKAGVETTAQIAVEKDNLLIRFTCVDDPPGMTKTSVAKNTSGSELMQIFGEDSIEIFIDVDRKCSGEYYQFAVNYNGAVLQAYHRRPQPMDISHDFSATAKSAYENGKWIIDFCVPLAKLTPCAIKAGDVWGINFCRNNMSLTNTGKTEYQAWSPTMGTFHNPRRFGSLTFK